MTAIPTRIAILLSGRGSNFLALHAAIARGEVPSAQIALVLSNVPDAPGLAAARTLRLPTECIPRWGLGRTRPPHLTPEEFRAARRQARLDHDDALLDTLRDHRIDLVCLAGYMLLIGPAFVAAFPNRILNIHPSLLPAFPGLEAQTQALDFGAKIAGCTVHFVDEEVDHGAIILQRAVPVLDDDTPATLSARILAEEHLAYPEALRRVLSGQYELRGRRFLPKLDS